MLGAPTKSGVKRKVTASAPPTTYLRPKSVILTIYFWLWTVLLSNKKILVYPDTGAQYHIKI